MFIITSHSIEMVFLNDLISYRYDFQFLKSSLNKLNCIKMKLWTTNNQKQRPTTPRVPFPRRTSKIILFYFWFLMPCTVHTLFIIQIIFNDDQRDDGEHFFSYRFCWICDFLPPVAILRRSSRKGLRLVINVRCAFTAKLKYICWTSLVALCKHMMLVIFLVLSSLFGPLKQQTKGENPFANDDENE